VVAAEGSQWGHAPVQREGKEGGVGCDEVRRDRGALLYGLVGGEAAERCGGGGG
jgi:hypothetical protein